MPQFSSSSLAKLNTCHPDLKTLFLEVIKTFDCSVYEGHRGQVAQDRAFAEGKSKLQYPHGKHNAIPSNAVDVYPFPLPAWKNVVDFVYMGGYVMGIAEGLFKEGKITHKIRYGGDFSQNERISDESFLDCGHFEIIL